MNADNSTNSTNSTNLSDSRLVRCFAALQQQNRAALVTFVTAGDPDLAISTKIINGLPTAGADIIEIGMPFSDPMADGPAIQAASLRALKAGMSLAKTLELVRQFRAQDATTPIVLMGYYNPIYQYGGEAFLADATDAGVDGLIIVDLPPEQDDELCHPCLVAGLHWIRLLTPTTQAARLHQVLAHASGFVYYVAIAGITGTRSAAQSDVSAALKSIRATTDLPIAVGFGIKTAEQVRQTAELADAVVVGSAVIEKIAAGLESQHNGDQIAAQVHQFVAELAAGLQPKTGRRRASN